MDITGLYFKDGILYLANGTPHPSPGMIPGNLLHLIPVQNSPGYFGPAPTANPWQPREVYKPTYQAPEPGTPITIPTANLINNFFTTYKTHIIIALTALTVLIYYFKFRK